MKRYKYVGKERDEETGLYYYGARYYSAWLGRFISVDPLQHKYPYYTPYQYAGNKPVTHIDIDGQEEDIKELNPPLIGRIVLGNEIARKTISKYGNNAKKRSVFARVLSSFFGLEGVEKQHKRGVDVEKFISSEVSKIVDKGTKEYSQLYNVSVGLYEESAYLSYVNNSRYKEYEKLINQYSSVDDKFKLITSRSIEISKHKKSFEIMGLILMAYASSFPGSSLESKVSNRSFSTILRYSEENTYTRVGQWMSEKEFVKFSNTGIVPRINVLTKGKEGWYRQAEKGDFYIEFDINSSLLKEKNKELGWSIIKSKSPIMLRLSEKKGQTLLAPIGRNIKHVDTK